MRIAIFLLTLAEGGFLFFILRKFKYMSDEQVNEMSLPRAGAYALTFVWAPIMLAAWAMGSFLISLVATAVFGFIVYLWGKRRVADAKVAERKQKRQQANQAIKGESNKVSDGRGISAPMGALLAGASSTGAEAAKPQTSAVATLDAEDKSIQTVGDIVDAVDAYGRNVKQKVIDTVSGTKRAVLNFLYDDTELAQKELRASYAHANSRVPLFEKVMSALMIDSVQMVDSEVVVVAMVGNEQRFVEIAINSREVTSEVVESICDTIRNTIMATNGKVFLRFSADNMIDIDTISAIDWMKLVTVKDYLIEDVEEFVDYYGDRSLPKPYTELPGAINPGIRGVVSWKYMQANPSHNWHATFATHFASIPIVEDVDTGSGSFINISYVIDRAIGRVKQYSESGRIRLEKALHTAEVIKSESNVDSTVYAFIPTHIDNEFVLVCARTEGNTPFNVLHEYMYTFMITYVAPESVIDKATFAIRPNDGMSATPLSAIREDLFCKLLKVNISTGEEMTGAINANSPCTSSSIYTLTYGDGNNVVPGVHVSYVLDRDSTCFPGLQCDAFSDDMDCTSEIATYLTNQGRSGTNVNSSTVFNIGSARGVARISFITEPLFFVWLRENTQVFKHMEDFVTACFSTLGIEPNVDYTYNDPVLGAIQRFY